MKRDMDLIRTLLLQVEENPAHLSREAPHADGYSPEVIAEHAKLLIQAGLVDGTDASTRAGPMFLLHSLTWQGHEFLEVARNETIWKKGVAVVQEKGLGMGFDVLKAVLTKLAQAAIGLP